MQFQQPFVAANFERLSTGGGNLPVSGPGGLPVRIVSTEVKKTKDEFKNNAYLQLNLSVFEGEHLNASGVVRLNLWNDNPQAVEIAQKTLATIMDFQALETLTDTDQLIGTQMNVVVQEQPNNPQYTRVVSYLPYQSSAPAAPTVSGQQQAHPVTPAAPVQQQPQVEAVPWETGADTAPAPQQPQTNAGQNEAGGAWPPWQK